MVRIRPDYKGLSNALERHKKTPKKLTDNENLALETLSNGTNGNVPQISVHVDKWRPLFYARHTGDR